MRASVALNFVTHGARRPGVNAESCPTPRVALREFAVDAFECSMSGVRTAIARLGIGSLFINGGGVDTGAFGGLVVGGLVTMTGGSIVRRSADQDLRWPRRQLIRRSMPPKAGFRITSKASTSYYNLASTPTSPSSPLTRTCAASRRTSSPAMTTLQRKRKPANLF